MRKLITFCTLICILFSIEAKAFCTTNCKNNTNEITTLKEILNKCKEYSYTICKTKKDSTIVEILYNHWVNKHKEDGSINEKAIYSKLYEKKIELCMPYRYNVEELLKRGKYISVFIKSKDYSENNPLWNYIEFEYITGEEYLNRAFDVKMSVCKTSADSTLMLWLHEQGRMMRILDNLYHEPTNRSDFYNLFPIEDAKYEYEKLLSGKDRYKKFTQDSTNVIGGFIKHQKTLQKLYPKSIFDRILIENLLSTLFNLYSNDRTPYHSITISEDASGKSHKKLVESLKPPKKDAEKYDSIYRKSLQENPFMIKMKRKDFWDTTLNIYKEYTADNLYPDIEKAVYELHDSLNLSWDDSVYVFKERFENLKNRIKEEKHQKELKEEERKEKTLEAQTRYAKEMNKRKQELPIKLLSHKIIGTIKTEKEKEKIIGDLFADNSCVALKIGTGYLQYGIFEIKNIKAALPETTRNTDHFAAIKNKLKEIVETGMMLAELEWGYENKTYKTTAIISKENKIIYDNVGTIASSEFISTSPSIDDFRPDSTQKTDEAGMRIIQPLPFERSIRETNLFGDTKYYCAVFCRSTFTQDGTLEECDTMTRNVSDPFHNCKAEIKIIDGEIGRSKQNKFNWVIAQGRLPIKLAWDCDGRLIISYFEFMDTEQETQTPEWW